MRSREDLIEALTAAGYTMLDDDPLAAVQVLHRPSPRKGLFGAEPMHSVALLDLLGDSPSRFLELALSAGKLVDQVVTGTSVGELEHPTLQTLAAMMSPGKKGGKAWRHPLHRILIVMDAKPAPPWASAVVDGAVHDHRKRCSIPVIRDEDTGELHLPTARSPQLEAVVAWAREVLGDQVE